MLIELGSLGTEENLILAGKEATYVLAKRDHDISVEPSGRRYHKQDFSHSIEVLKGNSLVARFH